MLPVLIFCFSLILPFSGKASETDQKIIAPVKQSIAILQKDQKNREQWIRDREKLTGQLMELQELQKQLLKQKNDLLKTISLSEKRIAEKKKKLADIDQISNRIEPFLEKTVLQIRKMIENDSLHFLMDERTRRLEHLEKMMQSPDITVSEKYRKMMETLLVEAEYGFNVETGQQYINLDEQTVLVNIFRLGRLNLFYLTLDEKECGFYNVAGRSWQSLPVTSLAQIRAAIDIAARRRPAELLDLPLGRIARQ
jgi:hypothetical protein